MKYLFVVVFALGLFSSLPGAYACTREAALCPNGSVCPRNYETCEWRCDLCGRGRSGANNLKSGEAFAAIASIGRSEPLACVDTKWGFIPISL